MARWLPLILLLFAFAPAQAQVTYPPVLPGVELQLPRDEGAHPDYRIEWWYVTGWVQDERGAPLGFQVTFFRVRPWARRVEPESLRAAAGACSGMQRLPSRRTASSDMRSDRRARASISPTHARGAST